MIRLDELLELLAGLPVNAQIRIMGIENHGLADCESDEPTTIDTVFYNPLTNTIRLYT